MVVSWRKGSAMKELHVSLGEQVSFSKTVAESDVYMFAGITGDLSVNHVNEAYMKGTIYGRRIAHGALLIGFMSTTSTMVIERSVARGSDETAVSLGYDRIRFLKPVFFGDTITVTYTVEKIDAAARRSWAKVEIANQDGELVAVGQHLLKWTPNKPAGR
jgi:3-hydroxybutyryl-CoA dehydratase